MNNFSILKNNQIDNEILRKITDFDRRFFPLEEDHSFPDGYLESLYENSKDGFFIMLDEEGNIIGYTHSIFLSDENQDYYLRTKDYMGLKNIGFNIGENNLYFYSLVVDKEYRDTDIVKQLMKSFTKWLEEEKKKGKKIKSCISEAITKDGIKTLTRMGMLPQDVDESGLGIYYSPDCLEKYINIMNQERENEKMRSKDCSLLTTQEKVDGVINDYNDVASEYADEFYNDSSDNPYIDKFLESLEGKRILDAGCGCGEDCKYIDEKGFETIGIDLSEGMLKIAREKYPNGKFITMDMTRISCSDNTFDGIISNCSLFHIPSELLPQTLEEFRRVLKPNGKLLLVLQEGNGEMMVEEPYRPGVYIYMKYFSEENIRQLLKQHNFRVDEIAREAAPSEFELGSGKLIVYASRERLLEQSHLNPQKETER